MTTYLLKTRRAPSIAVALFLMLFLSSAGCTDDEAAVSPDNTGNLFDAGDDVGDLDAVEDPDSVDDVDDTPPSCSDGLQNGGETDVDCGGPHCPPCTTGSSCTENDDCVSGQCAAGVCQLRSCDDAQCDGDESCYRGVCYPSCENTDGCDGSSRCYEDHCAPFECGGVPCEADEFCVGGICYPPCSEDAEEACPDLDFVTEEPGAVEADSALLRATFIELPLSALTDHGFCWSNSADPSHDDGECHSLGEPQSLGGFEHEVTELSAGSVHYARAFAMVEADTFYANEIEFTTLAPAPSGVSASQGTSADHVEVTWAQASGASGYIVYRDGQEAGAVDESTVSFLDTGADAPVAIGAPADIEASGGDFTDRVEVVWSALTSGDDAETHEYTVAAVYPDVESEPSTSAAGYRSGSTVEGYEVRAGDAPWIDVGSSLSYSDTSAPQATIEAGAASATEGEYESRVVLELSGASAAPGEVVSYQVRAQTSTGAGPASEPVSGYRGVGPLTYQWQRSSGDADSGFDDLAGAVGASHDDTTAPNDGSERYYRNQVSADGAASQYSTSARGFRAVYPTVTTDTVMGVTATGATLHGTLAGMGVPQATIHGFCWGLSSSPSVDDGQGTDCQNLGDPSGLGSFSYTAAGLTHGSTYYARAYATNNAGTVYGSDISFVTPPQAPTGVAASSGTFSNYVRVSWNPVAGAEQYQVLRNGVVLETVTSTTFDDTSAAGGGLPTAPELSATSGDHTDRVVLSWDEPSVADGATYSYSVVAVYDGVAGAESSSDTGWRAPYPVLTYELQIDGSGWSDIGPDLSYDDTEAPAGVVNGGEAAATDGEFAGHVTVELAGADALPGAQRDYQVRAVSAAGTGAESSEVPGNRGVGSLSIQWQRSADDSDDDYSDIPGAVSTTYDDDGAPPDGSGRYYRAFAVADGAASQNSTAARGFRAALPAVSTGTADVLGTQALLEGDITFAGAPDPDAHGFCWGTSPDPDLSESGDTICEDLGAVTSLGTFTHTAQDLAPDTAYHYRAFATTNAGTVYGDDEIFVITCPGSGVDSHEIYFSQTTGWTNSSCCNETNYRVAEGEGDVLAVNFTDTIPAGTVVTGISIDAGIRHACQSDPDSMDFHLNNASIGTWNRDDGPHCACSDPSVASATFDASAAPYNVGGENTVSIVHNSPGSCHQAIGPVPGQSAETAFVVTVAFDCQ